VQVYNLEPKLQLWLGAQVLPGALLVFPPVYFFILLNASLTPDTL